MTGTVRLSKTPKGIAEIAERRNNLRGKLRTMLILIDPAKTLDELRQQASLIGVSPEVLDDLVQEGYVATVGGAISGVPTGPGETGEAAQVSTDDLARFRAAKDFINDTVVTALGLRAFMFTLRLERCSTLAELEQLMPDYEKALRKSAPEPEAKALTGRLREMLICT
ncbi:MAG: hypothetical protein ABI920_15175 [Casimicrobiaceae bacterium]